MDKEGIVEYVMSTPGNTNEQVLRMALDNLEGGGGGGSKQLYQHVIQGSSDAPKMGNYYYI